MDDGTACRVTPRALELLFLLVRELALFYRKTLVPQFSARILQQANGIK